MKQVTRKTQIRKNAEGFDVAVVPAGVPTRSVSVMVDRQLGTAGRALGEKLIPRVQAVFDVVFAYFVVPDSPKVNLILSGLSPAGDGRGGSYHWGPGGTDVYVDADLVAPNGVDRALALFAIELTEIALDHVGKDKLVGTSTGEALARFIGQVVVPGVLEEYSSAPAWLNGARQNWIDAADSTDGNEEAIGCGVMFLFWLRADGHHLETIVQAAKTTFRDLFFAIASRTDAWTVFMGEVAKRFPPGTKVETAADDLWGQSAEPDPPPPPPAEDPPPPAAGKPAAPETAFLGLVFEKDVPAGRYVLVSAELHDQCVRAGMTVESVFAMVSMLVKASKQAMALIDFLELVQRLLVALGSSAQPLKLTVARKKRQKTPEPAESAL